MYGGERERQRDRETERQTEKIYVSYNIGRCKKNISMGESNTVVSAYTLYRHLQQYCSHLSICIDEPTILFTIANGGLIHLSYA